jgi:DNA-directed RNA polymerase subunit alpha
MYLTIGRGRGYSPAEDNKTEDQPIGVIPIDSIFSPIKRASYRVDSSRVGQRTDFDKLSLQLETDGSLEPGAALREAAELMIASLAIFTDADRVEELTQTNGAEPDAVEVDGAAGGGDDRLIEELEIGVRAYNCLKRAGVQTIGDLQAKSESELKAIPNFGERSIEEVIEAMHGLGLALRDE